MTRSTSALPYLILLLALGANTLIVELTIPRMIAPVFGNTLFSWTAIIAVVLVALTAGYRLGGVLALRVNTERFIVLLSLASAIWVFALSLGGDRLVGTMGGMNMMLGPLVSSAVLAAVPGFLDAAVVPLVIQILPGERGEVSGRCFAWSTVGSIIGVLATGYFLLPQFGISGALVAGMLLVGLALLTLGRRINATAVGAACVVALLNANQSNPKYLVDESNGYHRLRVTQQGEVRNLYLDNTLEGQIRLGEVKPVAGYMIRMVELVQRFMSNSEDSLESAFFLGGGSFSMPRFLKFLDPGMQVTVAEVDLDVVRIGRDFLELGKDIGIEIGDGRQVLAHSPRSFDLIVNDAFQGLRRIPFHLTTTEFNRLVDDRLSPHGIYMANVRGDPGSSYLASSFVRTLSETFPHVYAEKSSRSNFWVIAAKQPLAWATPVTNQGSMAQYLTDNHAPVEYLIVRDLISERLRRLKIHL